MTSTKSDLHEIIDRIRAGIEAELKVAARSIPFRNLDVDSTSGVLTFVLESKLATLDQSMEDASLEWVDPEGAADIISVVPELSQIHAFPRMTVL